MEWQKNIVSLVNFLLEEPTRMTALDIKIATEYIGVDLEIGELLTKVRDTEIREYRARYSGYGYGSTDRKVYYSSNQTLLQMIHDEFMCKKKKEAEARLSQAIKEVDSFKDVKCA